MRRLLLCLLFVLVSLTTPVGMAQCELECEGLSLMEAGFGQLECGEHAVTKELKLMNSGDAPLTISNVEIRGEGKDAYLWGLTLGKDKAQKVIKEGNKRKDLGWYVVIPADSFITLNVQFDPSVPDEWKFEGARLIITHDDDDWDDETLIDGNQISLNLTGYTVPVELSEFTIE